MFLDLQYISNWHSWKNLNMLDIIYNYISLYATKFIIKSYDFLHLGISVLRLIGHRQGTSYLNCYEICLMR